MKRLVLLLIFLATIAGCSGTMVSKDDVRVNDEDEVTVHDEPLYPELSCPDMEGEARTSVDRRISFENVSLVLDQTWIAEAEYYIKPACVLTSANFKPEGIGGRTIQFSLRHNFSDEPAQVSVFKIKDYKAAFAKYPEYFVNRDAELKSLIADSSALKTYGLEPPPHVVWMDASEKFFSKAAKIDFGNGRGLLTVTFISQDAFGTISNSGLRFLFQGFTIDGEYFVEMDFPAKLNGLPEEGEEFIPAGWSVGPEYSSPKYQAAYERYLLETAARIDNKRAADFKPRLSQIESFIHDFEIKTGQ